MLHQVVPFLAAEVNNYIARRTGSPAAVCVPSAIVSESGTYAFNSGEVAVHLINVVEERALAVPPPPGELVTRQQITRARPLHINLYLLFAAYNEAAYTESLRHLSYVLTFFQAHPLFTSLSHPALDAQIERLTVDLQSLSYEDLNRIWASIGGKQLPAVVYRVRGVILLDDERDEVLPPITEVQSVVVSDP